MLRVKYVCGAFCLLVSILANSCTFNRTYLDEEEEKQNAEKVTDSLYGFIQDRRFSNAESLFSKTFYGVTSKEDLNRMFVNAQEGLGKYKSMKLIEWHTRRVVGTDSFTEYLFVYDVNYGTYNARELIRLMKEKNGIKIVAYNINSEDYIKP